MNNNTAIYHWPNTLNGRNIEDCTVGVISLSAPDAFNNPESFARGLNWLKSKGFKVKIGMHTCGQYDFLSAKPQQMLDDLYEMLEDNEVDLVFTSGGGTNSNSLLKLLDFDRINSASKPIMGLSNSSVLLNAITARTGLITLHGPVIIWNMGAKEGLGTFSEKHMINVLQHSDKPIVMTPEDSWEWLQSGSCTGPLFGGNLWSIQQLLGTLYEPDWDGAILFIEDCFCQLHQIHAILTHFDCAGILDRIAGLIVGIPMEVAEEDYDVDLSFNDIVVDVIGNRPIPILSGVRLGHTDEKITIPIGSSATLSSTDNQFIVV